MNNIIASKYFYVPQWRWIIVAICFFILYHIFLEYFLPFSSILGEKFWIKSIIVNFFLLLISLFLGIRSQKLISIECGIAAILYIVVLRIFFPSFIIVPEYLFNFYVLMESSILGFVSAFTGAGIGWMDKKKLSHVTN